MAVTFWLSTFYGRFKGQYNYQHDLSAHFSDFKLATNSHNLLSTLDDYV